MENTGDLKEKIQEFVNSPYFYVVLAVLVILLVFILVKRHNRKKIADEIEEYQVRLNSLRSVPLPFKVTKALALARVNKDVDEAFTTCQQDFESVQSNLKTLQEMINDSDEYVQLRKYNMAKSNNEEIENLLDSTTATVNSLNETLNTILEKEDVQRGKITELKEIYHGIKLKINNNPDQYLFCWEALDRNINDIDHLFSDFETIMASNDFDKANEKTEEIKNAIEQLSLTVDAIPSLIAFSRSQLPGEIEEVQNIYVAAKSQGTYLDHLEIPTNLGLINDFLQEDLRRIKECNIEGVNEQLLECETRLSQLKEEIEREKKAHNDVVNMKEVTSRNMSQLMNTVESLNVNYNEMNDRYGLESNTDTLSQIAQQAKELNEECHTMMNVVAHNDTPSSQQLMNLSKLNTDIVVCLNEVNNMSETVRNASTDEQSARDQLTKLSIVLNDVEAKIRNNRIPSISADYNEDIRKAHEYLDKLESLLNETPINVTLVNTMKNSAVDLITSLFEKVNRILGTAIMAEKAIVIGNMYRSTYPNIDSDLTRSELAYRNGEYTQSLTIAMNTIRKVHPDTYNELLEGDKKEA